jgi:aminoglycoside phosphotransferase (APT) family kinase protein
MLAESMLQNRMHGWDYNRLTAFVARHYGANPRLVRLQIKQFRCGLQAAAVGQICASWIDGMNRPRRARFVVKWSAQDAGRELAVYRTLLPLARRSIAPRLLDQETLGGGAYYLYLENIHPWKRWPWRDLEFAASVLEQLAHIHASVPPSALAGVPAWHYEDELLVSARLTLESYEAAVHQFDLHALRKYLPHTRRLVSGLSSLRRQLLAHAPPVVLHGDAHPGNAIVRSCGSTRCAVLIDWSRARLGAAVEDTASWLQSLGFWEPEARRRHDTLLRRYRAARGLPTHLDRQVREQYWLAAASNAMAGALRHHLEIARCALSSIAARASATRAAAAWLRVVRQADACLRN